jgi:5-methylthioribose kinase
VKAASLGAEEQEADLLSTANVGPYLLSRGLVDPGSPVEAVELGGGVSNVVLSVTSGRLRAVVKQALPKLRVADEWFAKRERSITEARALQLAGRIEVGSVPQVLDSDAQRGVIVIDRAPDSWRNYKQMLLAGETEPRVADRCGEILGAWHSKTWDDLEVDSKFNDLEAFDQLRVDPYYRTAASRHPEVKIQIYEYIDAMAANRHALVHGDFSPKNVLAGNRDVWIVDFEVAHFGDVAFDLGFMLNHFHLKAIHRPSDSDGYRECADSFWNSYQQRLQPIEAPDIQYVLGHVGCLMLARVDGKSPAEYLDEDGRDRARQVSLGFLKEPPHSVAEAWARLAEDKAS